MTLRDIEVVARDGVNILIGYGRNTTGADVQAMQRAIALALEREASAPATPPGHVKMPASADEARGMVLLGEAWLGANAPDRLDGPAIVALREVARTGPSIPPLAGWRRSPARRWRTGLARNGTGTKRPRHPLAPPRTGRERRPTAAGLSKVLGTRKNR